jgi:hypothetical protein
MPRLWRRRDGLAASAGSQILIAPARSGRAQASPGHDIDEVS